MKFVLYDIILHTLLAVFSPYFLFKMLTTKKYASGLGERFGRIDPGKLASLKGGPVVWVHAVSVGETKAVLPVVKLLKERCPDVKVVFSTITKTGQAIAGSEGTELIDSLIYYPLDLSWVIRSILGRINPSVYVVVEKEVWPNIIRLMHGRGVPVAVVNGTISEKSFKGFMRLKFLFGDVFSMMSFYGARTEADRSRALRAGVKEENAVTTGNIKFDMSAPALDPDTLETLKRSVGAGRKRKVVVAGSTHAGEDEIILDAFVRLKGAMPSARLVIAPRHPERFDTVASLIKKTGLKFSRRSSGEQTGSDVLLLDTIGELMTVYSLGDIAIVGGSLVPGIGGHNLLEPAYFAKPVLYGPHLSTYLGMAEMLEDGGGGVMVDGKDQLYSSLKGLLSNDIFRKKTGDNARNVVESNRGAVEKTVEAIRPYLSGKGLG